MSGDISFPASKDVIAIAYSRSYSAALFPLFWLWDVSPPPQAQTHVSAVKSAAAIVRILFFIVFSL